MFVTSRLGSIEVIRATAEGHFLYVALSIVFESVPSWSELVAQLTNSGELDMNIDHEGRVVGRIVCSATGVSFYMKTLDPPLARSISYRILTALHPEQPMNLLPETSESPEVQTSAKALAAEVRKWMLPEVIRQAETENYMSPRRDSFIFQHLT